MKADNTPKFDLSKYTNFADLFFKNLTTELPEYTEIKKYANNLVKGKQPPYDSIYSLVLIKLESLKIYIKIYLANSLIQL